ncbi:MULTISPECIES: FecR family protein [Sphingobacterium]|uniref:FecR family protein n=1 Tax=Sphingobacterium TaxID=28453 RepID=UPI0025798E31|nr:MULTISPECIES: FecR family protein [Sphingobacterium]
MIYNRTYVKELIRKRMDASISFTESDQLEAAEKIFSEEEFDAMIAEVIEEMSTNRSNELSIEWRPDFEQIQAAGDRLAKKKKRQLWWRCAAAAVLFLLLPAVIVMLKHRNYMAEIGLECASMSSGTEIPLSESAGTIMLADSSIIRLDTNATGVLLDLNGISLAKTAEGVLEFDKSSSGREINTKDTAIVIRTAARQQCVIEFSYGMRVRLNAQSTLRYPLTQGGDSTHLFIEGEVLIDIPSQLFGGVMVIQTSNGKISSDYGRFELASYAQFTRATVSHGEVLVSDRRSYKSKELQCLDEAVVIKSYLPKGEKVQRDSLFYLKNGDFEQASQWANAVREYKDVPLKEFVWQMSRWHGFAVKNMKCIPNKLISTTVCYRTNREKVYAVIRDAGVLMYEKKGMISFCPEDHKDSRTAMK